MVMDLTAVRALARSAWESLYEGFCDVYTFTKVYDENTHRTSVERVRTHENVACHCSYGGTTPATITDNVSEISQSITLYLAPEVDIPAGSVIEVTQAGKTTTFEASGTPRVYLTHQEISLISTDKKA